MTEELRPPPPPPANERRSAAGLRRFAIALTRRELPSPVLSVLLSALGNHEPPEMRAVFIEDADLFNAVALPFIHELCVLTHVRRPIDRARLEVLFEREAAAASSAVAELVQRLGWRCQFEVLRARKATALRATLADVDVLLLPGVAGRAQRSAAAPVLAVLDDSTSGTHCRLLAQRLATAVGAPLTVCQVLAEGQSAAEPGGAVALDAVPSLIAGRQVQWVLLAAALVPRLAHHAVELDEMCAAPLLVVN